MKTPTINNEPVTVQLDISTGEFSPCMTVVDRKVSDMTAMFEDSVAVNQIIEAGDRIVYQIRYYHFITSKSDMALATSVIFPGTVGNQYHMTKGHFHEHDDQPEIYYCVQGKGFLQMMDEGGKSYNTPWEPGTITHIPPQYAHRVVNTGDTPLVFVASFHVAAGHIYGQIEDKGFKYLIVEQDGGSAEIINPRWSN